MTLFEDNERMLAELIKDNWDLHELGNEPVIGYKRDQYFQNARVGSIYVYATGRHQRISTVDYRTLERTAQLSIRIANPDRDRHYQWCSHVYDILMRFRRAGPCVLNGYGFMEVVGDTQMNDLMGFYVTTIDVRLTAYAVPIRSSGFGTDRLGHEKAPYGDAEYHPDAKPGAG